MIELTIGLTIFAVLLAGVLVTWERAARSMFMGSESADLQQSVRIGHDRMVRELRLARMNSCNDVLPPGGSLGVTQATATAVRITYFDPGTLDCTVARTFRTVTYSIAGGALMRDLGTGAVALTPASLIGSLQFRYFNCAGTQLTAPVTVAASLASIARIEVVTAGMDSVPTVGSLTRALETDVRLRNRSCVNVAS